VTVIAVDVGGVGRLAVTLTGAVGELVRIAMSAQATAVHPALLGAAAREPARVARAVYEIERAVAGIRRLAAGYARLAADATAQVAALQMDSAAGALAGVGLRTADLTIAAGGAVLARVIPERPGVVREVPAGDPLPAAPSLAQSYERIRYLRPGEVEVVPVLGADGVIRYLVLLRGMEPSLNRTVNTPPQAVRSSRLGADAYSRGITAALRTAGIPPGSQLMLVGHSQGGAAAMNVAAGGPYRVTHVVTAGSPIANKRPAPGVRVLAVENQGDLVPDLDAAEERSNGWRTVHRFGTDRRLSQLATHHGIASGYLPELAGDRFSADPAVRAYLAGASPYLHGRPGAPLRYRLDTG
jgi:hypothetical protein